MVNVRETQPKLAAILAADVVGTYPDRGSTESGTLHGAIALRNMIAEVWPTGGRKPMGGVCDTESGKVHASARWPGSIEALRILLQQRHQIGWQFATR